MKRRSTPIQSNYPVPEDFVLLAKKWRPDAVDILLGFVWQGFDQLAREKFNAAKDDQNLEDDITYAAYCRIQDTTPYSPFQVIHQPPEPEKGKATGPSPRSDLGFRLRGGNVRSHFTIEAKVIKTERGVAKYVNEITGNLLTARYAAFSSEAAMLGYLFSGCPQNTFKSISQKLQCPLNPYPAFPERNHRYSDHLRETSSGYKVSPDFRCHHMIIVFPVT
ncbi:MAG: hypothetical protein WA081_03715 [Desulfosalsimonadaceae bacterium]